jgi:lysozyme family protein
VFQVLLALDQLANAVLFGYADESISARCYRLRRYFFWYWSMVLVDRLFFWSKAHCERAFKAEARRHHLPKEYRRGVL